MDRCPQCNAELPAIALYCPICGTRIEEETLPAPAPEPAPPAWRVSSVSGPEMMGPAFMAGLAGGFLVGVPGTSNCFCLWMLGCGALGVFFFQKQFGRAALPNEAARVGAMSGFFGFLVASLVSFVSYALIRRTPLGLLQEIRENLRRSAGMVSPEDAKRALEMIETPGGALLMLLTFGAMMLFAFLALSTLGGLLAGAVTRKK